MVPWVDRRLDLEKKGAAERCDNRIEIVGTWLMHKIEKHKKLSK